MDAPMQSHNPGLPREGEHVAFMLDGRDVALQGTYAQHRFRSHWSDYDPARIRSWWPVSTDVRCGTPDCTA